jgi:hypothetical protein
MISIQVSHRLMRHLIRRLRNKPRFPYKGAGAGAALLALLAAGLLVSGIRHKPPGPQTTPEPPRPALTATIDPPAQPPPLTVPAPEPEAKVEGCPKGCTEPEPGCEVKGNISKEGERIYHLPDDQYYGRTVISPEKGERWFCTGEEAEDNGWRHAKV